MYLSEFWYYFEISRPVEISTKPILGEPTNKKIEKNPKFQNTLKYDLNEFWYRFRVQNASKTPQVSISSHITSFWAISADVWKIEFSLQMTILTSPIMADYMAGSALKCDSRPEIASRDPKNNHKYLGWWYLMIRTTF